MLSKMLMTWAWASLSLRAEIAYRDDSAREAAGLPVMTWVYLGTGRIRHSSGFLPTYDVVGQTYDVVGLTDDIVGFYPLVATLTYDIAYAIVYDIVGQTYDIVCYCIRNLRYPM